MAIDITGNPYACYPGDEPGVIKEGICFVQKFVFENYTDTSHRCRIVDRDGRDVFNVRGSTDYFSVVSEPGCLPFWDLTLLELQSGNLYIFLK